MSCTGNSDCLCGCCSGTSVETPQVETNPPGLSSIAYRAGTWATFKESMLARLSTSDYPALAALKTREDDDFTIAFLDATATVLDILTFYQERLANESYLRTATQLRSLTELSRLIGYQPAPGVSASVYLAFTLKAAPGLTPDPSTPAITIPAGSQVQSVPAQGQKPQTFETSAAIQAKADWNALPVQTGQPWIPPGASSVYLSGTSTQLQTGDSLLILGVDRETKPAGTNPSEQWDVVVLNRVETDTIRNLTYVSWDKRLSHVTGDGTSGSPSNWTSAKVYAFRQKAALFGHNAPNPSLFVNSNAPTTTSLPALINDDTSPWQWFAFQIPSSSRIDLDAAYPKIAVGSWFALVRKSFAEFRFFLRATLGVFGTFQQSAVYEAQLYKVQQANSVSLANFGLSGKVTELAADFTDANIATTFPLQSTEVWAQSEELPVGDQPLNYPLYGRFLDLKDLRPDLVGAKVVALSGNRQKITVADGITTLVVRPRRRVGLDGLEAGRHVDPHRPGAASLEYGFLGSRLELLHGSVDAECGRRERPAGHRQASQSEQFHSCALGQQRSDSERVCAGDLGEQRDDALLPHADPAAIEPGQLLRPQHHYRQCQRRPGHSRPVGDRDSGQWQRVYRQSELHLEAVAADLRPGSNPHRKAKHPAGPGQRNDLGRSAQPLPSALFRTGFCHAQPTGRHRHVQFGDGVEGATLPTGQNNIHANYRIGSGSQGNVGPGTLTTLMDRPLGVSGVTNPTAATGGQDPASIDDLRSSAPQTVLTLGRAVSITDYQSYASTFAGIAKAHAIWIPNGPGRGVFLTVAGVNGSALPPGNPTLTNLVTSLHNFGNPLIPITARSFLETLFGLSADLQYDPSYDPPTVKAAVLQALTQAYSFAARTFGQGVSVDEIAAVIQAVAGRRGGECDGHPHRGDQRRRRPGRPVRRLQRLQSQQLAGATGHAAAPVFGFPNPHLRLSAGRRNPLRAAAGGDSGFGSRS